MLIGVPIKQAENAIRAATALRSTLRPSGPRTMSTGGGREWACSYCALDGLGREGTPDIVIVAPRTGDARRLAEWVAELPGLGWTRLDDADSLAAFFAASPALPALSRAEIAAATLHRAGGEGVLETDEDVEGLLSELAPRVSASQRGFHETALPDGWRLGFLAARLAQTPTDRLYRLTVARWEVTFADGELTWRRTELIANALLDRYAPRPL